MATGLITPVILSGGSGTRLWPMSRRDYPKQFLPLARGQHHAAGHGHCAPVEPDQSCAPVMVVCNEEHRFMVAEQLRRRGPPALRASCSNLLGRNTAPALTAAALWLLDRGPDALMLVLPSDHAVQECARPSGPPRMTAAARGPGRTIW